ncbi:phage holin family protein [Rhodonellum sp.]|uniref:phage holin family protein n=1 Tax=Rhodonellum sp. TaxID=2231180 RepID=UPI002722D5EB|nr:phage holin family protein [Rhodonellum sp.]MDO9552596.1 phage holin family protein [Rhodonellum sp.]
MLNVSEIVQTIKKLIEVRFNIIRDEVQDQFSSILTRILILVSMAMVSLLVLLFLSISLAFYISELTYSTYKGFFYVGFIYLLVLFLLYLIRNSRRMKGSLQENLREFIFKMKK